MAGSVTWRDFDGSFAGGPQSEKDNILKITKPRD